MGLNCGRFFSGTSNVPEKNGFLAAILDSSGLRCSQEELGLEEACFHVLRTVRSTKSTTAS